MIQIKRKQRSTKKGISTIDPTNTWGSAHWENNNFSHIWEIVLFFTQNWGKQQHLGLYLLQVNVTISPRDNYCIEIVLRYLAVEGDGLGSHQVNDGGVLVENTAVLSDEYSSSLNLESAAVRSSSSTLDK
ncbi:hypothetical protein Peur_005684 [Populus x canadensis]